MTATTKLAEECASGFGDPSGYGTFFNSKQREELSRAQVLREAIPIGQPGKSCELNLFLGFFFDGTRNNYATSENNGDGGYSNVARLFDAYPGQTIAPQAMTGIEARWPDESKYPNYFRVYTPGVGTPFAECGDSGTGLDRTLGAAVALWSERRLVWGLVQAINAVHRYFHKAPLVLYAEALAISKAVSLDRRGLKGSPRFIRLDDGAESMPANAKAHLQGTLARLHAALGPHMPDPATGRPAKVDPGIVKTIFVSAFGFSRGAAATRAFANWFLALCELDARMLERPGPTLGGFPVSFDFIGLFDTVASVGLASSALVAHGHGGYADAEVSLRVPDGIACTHLVAAHETRRSFPLDSISIGGTVPEGCQEIVFPGVHSDVGGGYLPAEQGRGIAADGRDLLSRIPLAVMYREARLKGVPLKLELAPGIARQRFLIDELTIAAFNAYIGASQAYAHAYPRPVEPSRPLRAIMRTQMEIAMRWRRAVAGRVAELPGTRRAAQVDVNDLRGADDEFVAEMKRFDEWRAHRGWSARCPDRVVAACMNVEAALIPGLDSGRFDEWGDIERFWSATEGLDPALTALFQDLIHDSRAWFKLTGWEAAEVQEGLRSWVRRYEAEKTMQAEAYDRGEFGSSFTAEEEGWILEYRRTGQVPFMKTHGREPFEIGAGYLRFRRVYAGGDTLRITRLRSQDAELALAGQARQVEGVPS